MATLWLLTGLLAGLAGALFFRMRLRLIAEQRENATLSSSLKDTIVARDTALASGAQHLARVNELEREFVAVESELRQEMIKLESDLEHERALATEKLAAVQHANEQLSQSFKALSADALKDASAQFLELAKANFGEFQSTTRGELDGREKTFKQIVEKVSESLTQVDSKLERLDRDRRESHGAMQEHLRAVVDTQEKLRRETGGLVAALRQPQTRGRWGEMQLKRCIEMAGMLAHCDFVEQSVKQGEDGRLRPDVIVHMPGEKQVVVDAKAPLQSFLDAHNATDEDERKAHLANHARLLREHVRKLSAKGYWAQFDATPDFVFMFLPGEHFYNAALEADPGLLEEGVNQCVLIATPTTLIALLRAVAYGWQQEKVAESAHAVSELGRELHSRLAVLADHLQAVGRRLRSTVSAYNDAVGSMDGRVLVTARRFVDHGAVSASRELPDVDPVDLTPRSLQAPELDQAEGAIRALLPAGADDDA
jgi:DNA recombination protein RmuC